MKICKSGQAIVITALLLNGTCFAMSSSSYSSPTSGVGSGGAKMTSSSYSSTTSTGGSSGSKMTSSTYSSTGGFISAAAPITDSNAPTISSVKVDSRSFVNNDYIKKDSTLTATVTDETSLSTALSSVEVDGTFTTFAALSGDSSYSTSTGLLTYKFNFTTDGTHTIKIHAVDASGNKTEYSRTAKVNSTDTLTTSVYMYPNPFNPSSGAGFIAYQLTKDSDVSVYIFNAIGQLIVRKTILSGAEGGHAGYNEVAWDGKDDFGETVGNDIYFVRIVCGGKVIGKTKIAVIK